MSARQRNIFDDEVERRLLDQLLEDSRLYHSSKDYQALLDFVVKLRTFAPFNAMLLQLQKPGLVHAASAYDWRTRFGRTVKEAARPLVILWPFGPVALVYDLADTEGPELPPDVFAFRAAGPVTGVHIARFTRRLEKHRIEWWPVDHGDGSAGYIRVWSATTDDPPKIAYRMAVNQNHEPPVQFATAVHELGHLFLGHLGPDKRLSIPRRRRLSPAQMELEAESVSYIVCLRHEVTTSAESYLADFVKSEQVVWDLDVYQVLRAAGQVEAALGLSSQSHYWGNRAE
jgi:hypothetical protein